MSGQVETKEAEMAVRKDGGSAFPRAEGETSGEVDGMSLRDWFAGQALAGLLSTYPTDEVAWEKVSRRAYGLADAMLVEREKGNV